jgi:chromosome segregation ATPase
MTEEERLNQLSNDLNEAHTLVEIARRTLWSAETHPENADEPSARMRQILDHLDQAHGVIDTVLDEVEAERENASSGLAGDPTHRTIIH